MKTKRSLFFLTLAFILVLVSACGPSAPTEAETATQDPAQITSIALTAQAGVFATLTQSVLDAPTETPTPFATFTPENTITPLPSPTSSVAMISVEVETLCRLGPGMIYDRVGELPVNQMVEVFGLDPSRDYYLIRNPTHPEGFCWVWGFYATPVNNFAGIPVYTPAFTPTPRYTYTPTTPAPGSQCQIVFQDPLPKKVVAAGTDFDGTWTIKNIGASTWLKTEVDLKYISNTNGKFHKPSYPELSDLSADVAKDGTVKIIVDLLAPATSGTYTENWALVENTKTLCSMTFTIVVP
jgi:hypothetical protein